jgi:hypothetical protein
MSRSPRRPVLLAAALLLAGGSVAGAVAPAAGAGVAPSCGITWGSLPRAGGVLRPVGLLSTRTGRHDCYDRLVFEFAGSADGYRVQYASEVPTEGKGDPLSPVTAGGALLRVTLLEPAYDPRTGAPTYPYRVGDHVVDVTGYRTLRDGVFGGSFEGHTTFAVGVRARLPFQVFVLSGPGSHSRIVLDVAHRW